MSSIVTVTTPRTDGGLLVTLDAVKAELQVTASDTDDWLTDLIARLSEAMENYCNRVFAAETVSEAYRHSGGRRALRLSRYPLVAIASVSEGGTLLEEDEYEGDANTGELFRLCGDERIGWAPGKIVVAYSGGYSTVPGPLRQAVFDLVKLGQAERTRDPSLRSENILEGLYSYTLFNPSDAVGGFPPDVAAVLDRYRNVNI